jgi:mono/diheme cytochrome c family protein
MRSLKNGMRLTLAAASLALPHGGLTPAAAADGKAIYEKANCVGCHKWHGGGGGGYGGAALSLRNTQLDKEQLVEVVRCGRPGTRMPYHDKNAWSSGACYGIADPKTLGNDMPPQAAEMLSADEIASVADYVTNSQKGKGKPGREDCVSYWGEGSKQCQSYTQ